MGHLPTPVETAWVSRSFTVKHRQLPSGERLQFANLKMAIEIVVFPLKMVDLSIAM